LLPRAFLAVVPPDDVLDALERAIAPLADAGDARWSSRAQLHLTLQFLGRVDDEDELVEALHPVVGRAAPFAVRLAGGGAFGSVRRASVLWAGVGEGGDALVDLAGLVAGTTAAVGVPPEERPFHPHVTVARLARPRDVSALSTALDASDLGASWPVRDVVMFRSETRRDGARYFEEARLTLRSAAAP
jgi:2'-5' RNA ligase